MKRICTLGLCVLFFITCKRSDAPAPSSIQFKANGVQAQITGGRDTTGRDMITGAYYGCYASKPAGSNYYSIYGSGNGYSVMINIMTNGSLLETSYGTASVDVSFTVNGTSYGINNGDQMTVDILRYTNGSIDASFSGIISDIHANKETITEGHLNNIKVY